MYILLSVLISLLCFILYRVYRARRYRQEYDAIARQHGCLPPPMLQNQRPLGVDRLEQIFRASNESRLMELFLFHFRQTGYTLQQVFLLTPAFGTVDPANLRAMLSSKFADWDNGPRRAITFPMFGDGIFTQEGEAWKHSREILKPQLFYRTYENLEVFKQPVEDLLNAIPQKGGVVDLQPLFFRLTLDVTSAFLFGESTYTLRSPVVAGENTFASAFDTAQKYVVERFRLLDLYWLIGGREFREACERVHRFADQIIDRNLKPETTEKSNGSGNFLNSVAKECPDRDALRGQIVNILAAGRDTTACLLSWTFFLLVRHPHAMQKLREEVAELKDKGDDINRADLRKMNYLQNVMKETLRLYPSLPVNTRTAKNTTILPTGGGPDRKSPVLIPKGSAVAYSVYTLHRRPDLYGMDAEIFRPERWDEDMPLNQDPITQQWGYLPFSGGPRTCLGLDFALVEAAYTIVRIMQKYPNIRLPEAETVELTGVEKQNVTLVLQIKDGCKVDLA
ncbi:cytochrome P450 alkane hydroxylase [Aspergillus steynii IBT 23096]|uniref:Cytochrome P450 alkane hydroxylase n=1 Tax=Aspergillus steynii IBT 23096 TaxID=1392250 RepID=A0A2I2G0S0_9EURO|nr:cytochrome P450 alkane hydroxylase [Aspergillus steynii IBT 23096]PLB46480.1 cytochrome P450 alkane hydroxylase [Aspergillus steynii IBT 23096]